MQNANFSGNINHKNRKSVQSIKVYRVRNVSTAPELCKMLQRLDDIVMNSFLSLLKQLTYQCGLIKRCNQLIWKLCISYKWTVQNIFKNINAQRVIYSLTAPVFEKFKNVYMLPACSVNYAISVIIVLLNTALQIVKS